MRKSITHNYTNPIFFAAAIMVACLAFVLFNCSTTGEKGESVSDENYKQLFKQSYRICNPPIPEELSFAGEVVPIDNYMVREMLERELLVNTYWQSNILLLAKRCYRYFPIIEPILEKNNVPEDFKYLCVIESSLTNCVSPAKAAGFWQFMPTTGKEYGMEVGTEVDQRFDLAIATEAACKYLKNQYNTFKNWSLVALSYNAGLGGISSRLADQQVSSAYDLALNQETGRYLFRIMAAKLILENPEMYGICMRHKDLYQPIETKVVTVNTGIANLSSFAIANGINLKTLKAFNPWLRSSKLTNAQHKTYNILIPTTSSSYAKQIEDNPKSDELWTGF